MSAADRDDGGPAFPEVFTDFHANDGPHGRHDTYSAGGMKLRDYFAGQALTGWLASATFSAKSDINPAKQAKWAYELADALIEERSK